MVYIITGADSGFAHEMIAGSEKRRCRASGTVQLTGCLRHNK